MLLMLSPLVGFGFLQAVNLYREASRTALQFPELARGLSPFDGVAVPTFGAYYLASTLLLPFVAIRLIGNEKQSGSLKLLLQLPFSLVHLMGVKALSVAVAWALALIPGGLAVLVWSVLGGHWYWLEVLNLLLGHTLYGMAIVSIAFFAAAVTDSTATAAIVALAFTVGSWVLDFAASISSGWSREVASLSLTSALRVFERGLLASPQALQLLLLTAGLLVLTVIWLPTGRPLVCKLQLTVVGVALAAGLMVVAHRYPFYVDVSEDQRNSFNPADERALRRMQQPLQITIYLAPEDPRFKDFERTVLAKLRRTLPDLRVTYQDSGKTGLFGVSGDDTYGLIVYEYAGQRDESRSTSEREILTILHGLAGQSVTPDLLPDYPGYPLAADARHLGFIFYLLLPVLFASGAWLSRWPPQLSLRRWAMTRSVGTKIWVIWLLTAIMTYSWGYVGLAEPVQGRAAPPTESTARVIDFADETVGAPPNSFAAAVGVWLIGVEGDNKVLIVDGRQWKEGQASAGVAEQARRVWGERYAEFLDNVKAYAYYPYAVAMDVEDFRQGEISLRFKPIDGRIDQGAGILFNLKPNGDYLALRANALENNLVLWKFERGKRSSVKWIRNTPTPTRQWQELRLVVDGKVVKGFLNGKLYLEDTLPTAVSGKVSVWSKADSVVYFDEFRVQGASFRQ
jgi:hypothetical protein